MSEQPVELVFDLSKISLDEALDVLEYDPTNVNPGYVANLARSVKKCLVRGDYNFTGADLPAVMEAFTAAIMGGDAKAKN